MKKIISLFIAAIMFAAALAAAITVSAETAGFSDVEADRWSAASIEYAVKNGYLNGVGGGLFDPEGLLTRAMVATVLWRREGSPVPAAPSGFSDVPAGEWYTDAVAWARNAGVVKGLTETAFGPDEYITREQLATMLFRFSSSAPVSVPERADLSPFADDEKVSSWANEPLEWAVEAGLLKGTDGNRLDPEGFATREQFAAIIERYDGSFKLAYNDPVLFSHYTEPEYPLVTDADFYVSTDGSDDNDGSFAHPFRTWERARDAVRTLDRTGRSGIKVAFMAGDYGPLSIELTEEDSGTAECPITYCKYGDGDVVFNNGFDVKEEEFSPLDDNDKTLFSEKNADRIKKADVSAKLKDYDPVTCMILSEYGTLNLARFPNLYPDGTDQLVQAGVAYDPNHIHVYNTYYKNRIKKYRSTKGLILYGYIAAGWYKDPLETDGYEVDPETGNYVFYVPHPENVYWGYGPQLGDGFASDYFQIAILNVSEELDSKGEFWIDGNTGTLYVYDPSGDYHFVGGQSSRIYENESSYVESEEGGMVTLGENTDHVTFLGLSFRNSSKYMIRALRHPQGLTIDRCSFAGCSALNMVEIVADQEGRPADILITRCEFSTSAGRAVYLFAVNTEDLFNTGTGVVVDDNYFTLTGLRIGNIAALCLGSSAPLITHNLFRRCCWQCVDYGRSVNMIAEYNVFDNVCCNGDDVGAMGDHRNIETCGNVIRYNLFMNIKGGVNGRFGVYVDDGIGVEIVSNLFYNVDSSVMNNDISKFNTFCDNVTVKGPEVCDYSYSHTEFVTECMSSDDPDALTRSASYRRWVTGYEYFDSHPAIKEEAKRQWPGLFEITTDLSRWQEKEFCENSSLVITGNVSFNGTVKQPEFNEIFARYSTIEDNIPYSFEDNPLFVNPTRGDYRLRDGVDFPDFHFEDIGRY
ncbi:MAG: S-layer homology domain-containing protein [Clostridia bacterium]|nr:S-layer homology domain-containing protein [Clostridia bacterium]